MKNATKRKKAVAAQTTPKSKVVKRDLPMPLEASHGDFERTVITASCDSNGVTKQRRNVAGSITRTDRYANIEQGIAPFIYGTGNGQYSSNISVSDAIILCQKAYYNFSIFRNTIDLMTEFSCAPIFLTGGNEQSRRFYTLWLEKLGILSFQDRYFREYYRSGNVFLYPLYASFDKGSMKTIEEALGYTAKAAINEVPFKYLILNPADVRVIGASSFVKSVFVKVLNDFEIEKLLNSQTPEDKKIASKIPELAQIKKQGLNRGTTGVITLELDPNKIVAVFYKKQDYEPLAIPMGFPVLEDINWKAELKKMDMAFARTVGQMVLLVTMGSDELPASPENMKLMRQMFENQSVSRTIVADHTTEMEFKIPEISEILGPQKYEQVDRDIRMGLNNVLFGEEKFANASVKTKVFLARLEHARECFLQEFLIPQMKKIGKLLGFKSIPMPSFEAVDFEDNDIRARIIAQLIQLGTLTADEGITAMETGRYPTKEESIENQKEYKKLKDSGLYEPLIGAKEDPEAGTGPTKPAGGRPAKTKSKQTTKNVKPIGSKTSKASDEETGTQFSLQGIGSSFRALTRLEAGVEKALKQKFKIKTELNEAQMDVASELAITIISNAPISEWNDRTIKKFIANPLIANDEMTEEIDSIAEEHNVDRKIAALLYHSKK